MSKSNKNIPLKKVTELVNRSNQNNVLDIDDDSDSESIKTFKSLSEIQFRTESQAKYWKLIGDKEITFCTGPAGTGKSYISLAKALQIFSKERKKYKKIILVKPAVEAEENLGFLPGTVEDKLAPYIFSSKYLLYKLLGKQRVDNLFSKGKIEIMALSYIRGINIDNSIVIVEEAQNMSKRSMKTLLTRIGENSKYIISGDLQQQDLKLKSGDKNGLLFSIEKLNNIPEIGIFEFLDEDIIRNPVISKILKEFNGDV